VRMRKRTDTRETTGKNQGTGGRQTAGRSSCKSSRCPVSSRCGGCTMIDVPYDEQLKGKQALVEGCIGRFGPVDPAIRMKNPDHYRNKVTSVFGMDRKNKPVCGVYAKGTHEVVPVDHCLLEDRRSDAIVQSVMSLLPSFKIRVYDEDRGTGILRYVQVRTAHATGQVMVTIVTADPVFPSKNNFVKALLKLQPALTTIVQNVNRRTDSLVLGEREHVLYGPGYIEDRLCGKTFRISSRAFYQINSIQTEKLYHIAVDAAGLSGKETVLDAYCGIGTIGICASDQAKQVISVELNPDAVRDAVKNCALNHAANVSVYQGDAGVFMQKLAESSGSVENETPDGVNGAGEDRVPRIDVLFMDPPRAGASQDFLSAACMMAPKKIVYVSCDPVTLGRDVKYLTEHGYTMKKAVPVDMFPYVEHVETVALLTKTN
jgi:23S rRNA (uracil1939-C5)-methyltransferase